MSKKFIAIGHPTLDLGKPNQWGGGVTYACLAVKRLTQTKVRIVTPISTGNRYVREMKTLGIEVVRLPVPAANKKTITAFENIYDKVGNRRQIVHEVQSPITQKDLPFFPEVDKNTIVFVATVISEVSPSLFPIVKNRAKLLIVAPQGYYRQVTLDRNVTQKKWGEVKSLSYADMTILSEEDLTYRDKFQNSWFDQIRKYSSLTILTRGERGSTIYLGNKYDGIDISAFRLKDSEIKSLTGAGDVYAGLFAVNYDPNIKKRGLAEFRKHLRQVAAFSSLAAAATIAAAGGPQGGIYSIPTREQLIGFLKDRKNRLKEYYQELGMPLNYFYLYFDLRKSKY